MASSLASLGRRNHIGSLLGVYAGLVKTLERGAGPLLDLFIRLWLAQIFWLSGLLKLADWQHGLALARDEYPVSGMDPVTAAYLGIGIELVAPVLLAFGLATRSAALSLLVLSLVIQFNYVALDAYLFWAMLFAWCVIFGAGPISIDARIAPGLADTAIPFAAPLLRAFAWIARVAGPAYQFLMRGWLARAVFLAFAGSAWLTTKLDAVPGVALPLTSAPHFGFLLAAILAPLSPQMNFVWCMAFALLLVHGAGRYSVDHVIARRLANIFRNSTAKPPSAWTVCPGW